MRTFRKAMFYLLIGCCAACGHDRSRPDAAVQSADKAAADAGLVGDSGIPPEIVALTQRAVDAYDRQIKATCMCLVAAGAYDSQQACTQLLGSGSTWTDCGAKVLADNDSPDTRVQIDCFLTQIEQQADCTENAGCDMQALSSCSSAPAAAAACLSSHGTLIEQLLERCPDLGLLSR